MCVILQVINKFVAASASTPSLETEMKRLEAAAKATREDLVLQLEIVGTACDIRKKHALVATSRN